MKVAKVLGAEAVTGEGFVAPGAESISVARIKKNKKVHGADGAPRQA